VIIVGGEKLICVTTRDTVDQDIVDGLNVERFLDFSVWRNEQVDQNEYRDQQQEWPREDGHNIRDFKELSKLQWNANWRFRWSDGQR
jgi:hypothetical protein